MVPGLLVREQGDQREQAKECRCRAYNRYVIPLALGFNAEMRPHGWTRRFQVPAENEPCHDLDWSRIKICTQ
jgi:hypothetical protein